MMRMNQGAMQPKTGLRPSEDELMDRPMVRFSFSAVSCFVSADVGAGTGCVVE